MRIFPCVHIIIPRVAVLRKESFPPRSLRSLGDLPDACGSATDEGYCGKLLCQKRIIVYFIEKKWYNSGMKKKYGVGGMSCAACALGIEKSVSRIDGVESVSVSLAGNSMTVTFADLSLEKAIFDAVTSLGYTVYPYGAARDGTPESTRLLRRFLYSLAFLLPLLWFSMGEMIGLPVPSAAISLAVQFVLSAAIVGVNRRFFTGGARALFKGVPNMDTLVALASSVAFLYSLVLTVLFYAGGDMRHVFYESAAMVPTLVTLGKFLEEKSKGRTGREIERLVKMMPTSVVLLLDGKEIVLSAEEVAVGDLVVLRQGDRVPVDGVVTEGTAFVDTSAITGESLPVEVKVGDGVASGGVLASGYLILRAEKVGEESSFQRVLELVREASASKAPVQRVADKIAGVFVPIVCGIALVTFLLWLLLSGDLDSAFRYGIGVLVISCPCALGLATPVAVMAAAGKGASLGVLYKNAASIEILSKAKVLLLDKTATLTEGKPEVRAFYNRSDLPDERVLSLARAAELRSSHPLAAPIVSFCGESNVLPDSYEYITGKGGVATVEGERYYIGNASLLPFTPDRTVEERERGGTTVYFANDREVLALFVLADALKDHARETMALLSEEGYREVMLTGDNQRVAYAVAADLGVEEVRAETLPEDKARIAREYKEKGYVTVMTGDGINDSPALKSADVGVAMGQGTDVAIDAADVVLRSGEITALADALLLARKGFRVIKGNLFWAFFYNVVAIPIAAGAFASFGLSLTPTISAAAMSLSSLFVVTNALRINRYKRVHFSRACAERCPAPPIPNKNNDLPVEPNAEGEKENNDMCFKKQKTTVLTVEGMMCEHCKARVEKALSAVSGVKKVKVDLAAKTATVTGEVETEALVAAVTEAGYSANQK